MKASMATKCVAQIPAPVAIPVRKIQPSRLEPWLCLALP